MLSNKLLHFNTHDNLSQKMWEKPLNSFLPKTIAKPIKVVDFNNLFSFTGGGVRTYHLQKLEYFSTRNDVRYWLIVPSDHDGIDNYGKAKLIHVKATSIPFAPGYRIFLNMFKLRKILQTLQPDLIEVGGPYVDPLMIKFATKKMSSVITGYWHSDYPTAYFKTYASRISHNLGNYFCKLGWSYARKTYGHFDTTFAAADCVLSDLKEHGISNVMQVPLGVDTNLFNPIRRDNDLRYKYGAQNRPLIFFPHRLLWEKGIKEVVEGIPAIAKATGAVFVFAGTGPELPLVKKIASERDDTHYIGYISSPKEMARWYASSDLSYGMSAWETFGLSVVEAMSSGIPLVGANKGAAKDWITRSGCGEVIPHGDTKALINASINLLNRPDLHELGNKGRNFAVEHFSWQNTFDKILGYYRTLIKQKGKERQLSYPPLRLINKVTIPE